MTHLHLYTLDCSFEVYNLEDFVLFGKGDGEVCRTSSHVHAKLYSIRKIVRIIARKIKSDSRLLQLSLKPFCTRYTRIIK